MTDNKHRIINQDVQQGQILSDSNSCQDKSSHNIKKSNTKNRDSKCLNKENQKQDMEEDMTSSSSEGSDDNAQFYEVEVQDSISQSKQSKHSKQQNQQRNRWIDLNDPRRRQRNTFIDHMSIGSSPYRSFNKKYQGHYDYNQNMFPARQAANHFKQSQNYFNQYQKTYGYPPQNQAYLNTHFLLNNLHNMIPNTVQKQYYYAQTQNFQFYQTYSNHPQPFQPGFDHLNFPIEVNSYYQKQKIKQKIIQLLRDNFKKEQIIRSIQQLIIDQKSDLALQRLKQNWKQFKKQIQQILKLLQANQILRKMYQFEIKYEKERKIKRDPRLKV